MIQPVLKQNWERFSQPVEITAYQAQELLEPWKSHPIQTLELLSDGCANTNYKLTFKNDIAPLVLRLYTREKSALARECGIHKLLKNKFPVPAFLYINNTYEFISHPYALIEWIDGVSMRNVILMGDEKAISECSFSAGVHLNQLRQTKFPKGGFFQSDMSIRPFDKNEKYLDFCLEKLQDEKVRKCLTSTTLNDLKAILTNHSHLLPDINEANLTHADFDPANMLVRKINNRFEVVAILDWEFSFAGSYLFDMGIMLRYAHKLPKTYEESFIQGLSSPLPSTWRQSAKLTDLLCLLNLLYYNSYEERPLMNRDVVGLVEHTATLFRKIVSTI